jgi:3-oxoacyl-[acyl-carrier-protein] synthase III
VGYPASSFLFVPELTMLVCSMAIKTGCSASLVALHEACRAIQSGDATAAVVAGTSMIMTPTLTATMAAGELLSPEGSCKTFDSAADGFARAEAITAIYVKRLEDALRDGNPIRAIIRSSATNSDGKGKSLVTPNGEAQEALMRKAYEDAGLDPSDTAYVEVRRKNRSVRADVADDRSNRSATEPERPRAIQLRRRRSAKYLVALVSTLVR